MNLKSSPVGEYLLNLLLVALIFLFSYVSSFSTDFCSYLRENNW